jgi:hypothetical protein
MQGQIKKKVSYTPWTMEVVIELAGSIVETDHLHNSHGRCQCDIGIRVAWWVGKKIRIRMEYLNNINPDRAV